MSQPPSTVTISLTVPCTKVADALDFYAAAFGAIESFRLPMPDGLVAHAEFDIGKSHLYLSGEAPEWQALAMPEGTTASCLFTIQVDDCDAAHAKALAAGATAIAEPENHFWGSRDSIVHDPYGYRWCLNQKLEDLTPEQIGKRAAELFGG